MLLAPPPELQGIVPNMQGGGPRAAVKCTSGDWLWPLNFISQVSDGLLHMCQVLC